MNVAMRTTASPEMALPRDGNDWQLLRIYSIYRLIVSLSIIAAFVLGSPQDTAPSSSRLYLSTSLAYAGLCLLSHLILRGRSGLPRTQALISVIVDILCLALLEHSRSGAPSNLSLLQIVTVAAASILLAGRLSYFLAALATIVTFYDTLLTQYINDIADGTPWVHAGYTGFSLFATAFFSQQIVSRMRATEALAERQAKDLASLEELNHHIIQRMRTGIVVVDADDKVMLLNDAAAQLLGIKMPLTDLTLQSLSDALAERLRQWRTQAVVPVDAFRASQQGPDILASFTRLDTDLRNTTLIFVEDNSRLAQQAQQLKLASLGSLTASIAHEIRNPLGAASHAAQLLAESSALEGADRRLGDIIYKNCQRMNMVIENVLQLSRRGSTRQTLLCMNQWMSDFITEIRNTTTDTRDIELHCEQAEVMVRADPTQLHQVFDNLFQNGLRYSLQKTGKATLSVRVQKNPATGQAYVDVIDQGPGISEAIINNIFEPFFTSEKSGNGLGLYIARELCESNQARLDHIPVTDGCCFRVSFAHPEKQPPRMT